MSLINKKINKIVLAKGGLDRKLSGAEIKQGRQMRRSIHLKKNLEKNQKIKISDLILQRPGSGLPPEYLNNMLGKN